VSSNSRADASIRLTAGPTARALAGTLCRVLSRYCDLRMTQRLLPRAARWAQRLNESADSLCICSEG